MFQIDKDATAFKTVEWLKASFKNIKGQISVEKSALNKKHLKARLS